MSNYEVEVKCWRWLTSADQTQFRKHLVRHQVQPEAPEPKANGIKPSFVFKFPFICLLLTQTLIHMLVLRGGARGRPPSGTSAAESSFGGAERLRVCARGGKKHPDDCDSGDIENSFDLNFSLNPAQLACC